MPYTSRMQSQTTQIRVTLPVELQGYLQAKAGEFGLTMAAYVKNLIIDDAKNARYPVYKMSSFSISLLREAKREDENGDLFQADDMGEFLKNL